MNSGTRISRPVSSVAFLVTPPLAVSPRTPGSVDATRQLDVRRELHADRVAVVLLDLHEHVVGEELAVVPEDVRARA